MALLTTPSFTALIFSWPTAMENGGKVTKDKYGWAADENTTVFVFSVMEEFKDAQP